MSCKVRKTVFYRIKEELFLTRIQLNVLDNNNSNNAEFTECHNVIRWLQRR